MKSAESILCANFWLIARASATLTDIMQNATESARFLSKKAQYRDEMTGNWHWKSNLFGKIAIFWYTNQGLESALSKITQDA